MKERDFVSEIGDAFGRFGAYWWKIPDPGMVRRGRNRFTVQRPFDGQAWYKPKGFVAVECKVLRRGAPLRLEPHQERWLMRVRLCGHGAFVVARIEALGRQARAFAVGVERYRAYLAAKDRKSVSAKDIPGLGVELPRVSMPDGEKQWRGWDVRSMLAR